MAEYHLPRFDLRNTSDHLSASVNAKITTLNNAQQPIVDRWAKSAKQAELVDAMFDRDLSELDTELFSETSKQAVADLAYVADSMKLQNKVRDLWRQEIEPALKEKQDKLKGELEKLTAQIESTLTDAGVPQNMLAYSLSNNVKIKEAQGQLSNLKAYLKCRGVHLPTPRIAERVKELATRHRRGLFTTV